MINLLKKSSALAVSMAMAMAPMGVFAASLNETEAGSSAAGNPTNVANDLTDNDIIDKDAKGSIKIHKYDMTAAENDGISFSYSDTDRDSTGPKSKLTKKDRSEIDITSTGQKNTDAETALSDYALKGVEFSYLNVGDIRTLSDVNHDGKNGDIELVYGIDDALMGILGLSAYDAANSGQGKVAVTQADGKNYYTAQQINDALKEVMDAGSGRSDNKNGISAKDALEKYMADNAATAMAETDENGETSATNLNVGLYLIVETKVPENVTDTTNPWFVEIPFTSDDGENWLYDVECYPKNQTGNPTVDKKVRNAYGEAGKNGTITAKDAQSKEAGVTSNLLKAGEDAAYLSDPARKAEYEYNDTTTASAGDVLDFILYSKLPAVTSTATYLKDYYFLDTLSDGLKFNDDVKIAIYDNAADAQVNDTTKATVVWTKDDGMFTVTPGAATKGEGATKAEIKLTANGLTEVNTKYYDGDWYMVPFYTATVESDATNILGDVGNRNNVNLVWKRTNENYFDMIEDQAIVYSYGLDLTKTFSDGRAEAADFQNVKFKLYNAAEGYYVTATESADGVWYVTGKCKDKANATEFIPSDGGKMVINGLEADHYELTETHTASGYKLGQNQIDINIAPTTRSITPSSIQSMTVAADSTREHTTGDREITFSDGTKLTTREEGTTDFKEMVIGAVNAASATVDDVAANMKAYGQESVGASEVTATPNGAEAASSTNAEVELSIVNEKGFTLPRTGGMGMYLITILGVIAAITGTYYATRKKEEQA